MLTQELKTRWLEALRSGKFNHRTGGYRSYSLPRDKVPGDKVCHCALGVLLEITDSFAVVYTGESNYYGDILYAMGITHSDQAELVYLNDRVTRDMKASYDAAIEFIETLNVDYPLEDLEDSC